VFRFCRLLRLAGLRWGYSNPPPHGESTNKVKAKIKLRKTVSRPVCLGVRHQSGTRDQLFSFFLYLFIDLLMWAISLTRSWDCSFQCLLGIASTASLRSESNGCGTYEHILLSLFFETPPTWRTRLLYLFPPGTG
jgi:hypothetical protein